MKQLFTFWRTILKQLKIFADAMPLKFTSLNSLSFFKNSKRNFLGLGLIGSTPRNIRKKWDGTKIDERKLMGQNFWWDKIEI